MASKIWDGISTPGDWSVAANWVPSGVPVATDDVSIPAGSNAITAGLDQSAVALGEVTVEKGYSAAIGLATSYLKLDPNSFRFAGTGESYIDLETSPTTINPVILATKSNVTAGKRGLYLLGDDIGTLEVYGGIVGLAAQLGETTTVATLRLLGSGANVWIGNGVTLTTLDVFKGQAELKPALTTLNVHAGKVVTEEDGTITTATVRGGELVCNSSGTITTLNIEGGIVDFIQAGKARTVSNTKQNPGSTLIIDEAIVTITTHVNADEPYRSVLSRI